jgi:SAM-dependent methyltransferase
VGAGSDALPLLDARVLGVVLESGDPESIAEAKRVLVPGGRLVLLRPAPGAGWAVRDEGLEPIAEDAKAIVARRV